MPELEEKFKRCVNCKYWDNNPKRKFGSLSSKTHYDEGEYRECHKGEVGNLQLNDIFPSDGILALELDMYGENPINAFKSGPDFGCVHFEPKP